MEKVSLSRNPVEILFENSDIAVCVKPPGVSSEDGENSVPALMRSLWGDDSAYVGVIHRLDVPVGGVMVIARNRKAAAALSGMSPSGTVNKEYLCVCAGVPEPHSGTMENWLFRDSSSGRVYPVKGPRRGVREARLEYSTLSSKPLEKEGVSISLCRVKLITGRTHQIRVQFASRGWPLAGDGRYGSRIKCPIALWCEELTLTVPGEQHQRTFKKSPPDEFPFSCFSV